tara:strand:- start:746 stop:979 length:234 start_codon:yes stop_codon:yes gene_type:complete
MVDFITGKDLLFFGIFAVGIICSYAQGRAYGLNVGGLVGMNLMKEFFKSKLGEDEVNEMVDDGPFNYENWLKNISRN